MSATIAPAIHHPDRLAALESTALLDSPPEAAFDRLTALASKILHAPVSLVSLVDRDRQFFKSAVGLPEPWAAARETPLSHSFCQHVAGSNEALIVADARRHPLVRDNLAVSEIGVVAYAGVPLTTSGGYALGSFCAIDSQPREWKPEEIQILRDLAALTMTEIELRLAARQLQDNFRRLQRLEALRDDLTHMIIHDLRTPLTSFLGGLQSIEFLGDLNDDQREMLDMSVDGGQMLLGMVNNLLDISKMENESLQLNREGIDVPALVDAAVRQTDALANSKNLKLIINVEPDLPPFAADKDKLLRTLVNLLGNAIKFTPAGGCVTVAAHYANEIDGAGAIVFAVSDTGEGIPPQDTERIFEKFGQVEIRQTHHNMSTGLGLTFCKMAVEAHGGHIWVESELGHGSTFRFSIPTATPSAVHPRLLPQQAA